MIAYLKGKILSKNNKSVILLLNNIGYEVFLSQKSLETAGIGLEKEFFIHSQIKEDLFDLYGFESQEELNLFKKLISVSGVGPKSALNVLNIATVSELKRAIGSGDSDILQQVSGIGKKTAERLVVELKEKFIDDMSDISIVGGDRKQILEALVSLGYKDAEIRDVVKELPDDDGDLATKIKQALKMLNK